MMKKKYMTFMITTLLFANVLSCQIHAAALTDSTQEYITEDTQDTGTKDCTVSVTQAESFIVTIPRNIVLNGAKGAENSGTYKVGVRGDIAGNQVVSVRPQTSFTMKEAGGGKADLTASVEQKFIHFVDMEAELDDIYTDGNTLQGVNKQTDGITTGVDTTGKITVTGLTAGSYHGTLAFTIDLTGR